MLGNMDKTFITYLGWLDKFENGYNIQHLNLNGKIDLTIDVFNNEFLDFTKQQLFNTENLGWTIKCFLKNS